jgi:uncharacterized protein YndB with AHSA1/START domain
MPGAETTSRGCCVIRRVFAAPAELVYRAWSEAALPERLSLGPRWQVMEVEKDLRVDGVIRGRLRNVQAGREWVFEGRWREVRPGRRLACSLHVQSEDGSDTAAGGVVVEFVEHEGSCEVVVVHSGVQSEITMRESQAAWTQVLEALAQMAGNPLRMIL